MKETLTHGEIVTFLLQLAVILGAARLFAEFARVLKQPAVVGEILAGVLLGPTLLGWVAPEVSATLFPESGHLAIVLDGFIEASVVLLLFIAGLEVDLQIVYKQGIQAVIVSLSSLIVPFALGFVITYMFPEMLGLIGDADPLVFALFIGTTLSITALPVIARILMDLNVFRTQMGMLIIASAMIIDILGWLIFTVILSLMDPSDSGGHGQVGRTIGLTLGFTVFALTIGKFIINKILPWINSRLAWPGGVLSISIVVCLISAAFTEYIGIHAIFGAFIMGIAIGDSPHMTERAKEILHQFINNIFAPIFFVSIGLFVSFFDNFNFALVAILLALALVGKTSGAFFGARKSGLSRNQSLAVGFGMNTHGTLEVILAAVALSAGLIDEKVYVAILTMVIITIIISAPLMRYWLERDKESSKSKT